ncbi:hypothetical protein SDC9_68902 [bioreactor metagenome]|uniref:Uncharacterized protein n=1 Tax=bioreactor metagenome TaxID=1076179 RepID=A0A644Y2S0_9ZZZZ
MTADHLRITLTEQTERVDLDRSPLMCKLRAIMES